MMPETVEAAYARGLSDALALIDDVHALVPGLLPDPGERPTLAQLAEGLTHYDPASLAVLRPFDKREALALKEAADIAGRSESTVREWIARYAIGRNVVGSTMISHPALLALLDDDAFALAALLAGQRQHPAVLPYLERAGLRISA